MAADRAFPTSPAMLAAGAAELEAGMRLGAPSQVIANAVYQVMRRTPRKSGRPRAISDGQREEAKEALLAGKSSRYIREHYGIGGWTCQQLRRELGMDLTPAGLQKKGA